MRRLFCLAVLVTVALSASGCGTGVTRPDRAAAAVNGTAAKRTNPRDLVRPYQTHPDYAASTRRNDRERVDKTPLGPLGSARRLRSRPAARAGIGVAPHDTATRVSGSRAPPAAQLQLR